MIPQEVVNIAILIWGKEWDQTDREWRIAVAGSVWKYANKTIYERAALKAGMLAYTFKQMAQ